jgi:hypothetical protein
MLLLSERQGGEAWRPSKKAMFFLLPPRNKVSLLHVACPPEIKCHFFMSPSVLLIIYFLLSSYFKGLNTSMGLLYVYIEDVCDA